MIVYLHQKNKSMAEDLRPKNIKQYQNNYDDEGFWKITSKAGKAVITPALQLYYTLQSSKTPIGAKATIMGALGYLILPIDLVPDFIPVVGFSDDLAALLAAITTVNRYITQDIKAQAEEKLTELFG